MFYFSLTGFPRLSSSTTIDVHVADENDHSPEFEHGHYRGVVTENAPSPVSVAMVTAVDRDAEENGRVRWVGAVEWLCFVIVISVLFFLLTFFWSEKGPWYLVAVSYFLLPEKNANIFFFCALYPQTDLSPLYTGNLYIKRIGFLF